MPQWHDFLEHFRPAGTPGAAARPGVPADRSADAAAELTPLLLLLDDVQDEATRIRADATIRADEIRRAARRDAERIIAQARQDAASVQAEAEAAARSDAAAARAQMQAQNTAEIDRLRARATERMPRYVDKVVALAREWLDDPAVVTTR
jgi:cell division septum initiation protein DivIVA